MRYVVLLDPGPAWAEGEPVAGQDRSVLGAHLGRMRRRYDEGSLLFGGRFASGFGGVALLEAESSAAAAAIMDADPAVAAGLMTYRLHEVRPFFDAFAGQAWSPPASDRGITSAR